MERQGQELAAEERNGKGPAVRFLVQSALRDVMSEKNNIQPGIRPEWVAHLSKALMSESDAAYQSVLSSLMANGVSSEEIQQQYVPDVARHLGELWVNDMASFVDVTVGTARLQKLFRDSDNAAIARWARPGLPLGHSVLMVIPRFEQHSLGAFVAADDLRRHGLWVHMAIYMDPVELVALINESDFSMLGMTLAAPENIERTAQLVALIRENCESAPPIVIGGHAVETVEDVAPRCGADHAVRSVSEAIELCNLPLAPRVSGLGEVCK